MNHVVQNRTNEIIRLLVQGPHHVRGIADALGTSHVSVSRRLQELVRENVVDYTIEGKNKVYSLKKTLEGRNAVLIAEIDRQSRAIAHYPVLRGVIRKVLEVPDLRLALVFGSYAKGTAHDGSDIDLFIETQDRAVRKTLESYHSRISVKIGLFDPESPLIREIMQDHIIITGVEEYLAKARLYP